MNRKEKELVKYLNNQVFTLTRKVRKQARQIEKYRVAISKIEEIIHET